jgi:hypothetical protein
MTTTEQIKGIVERWCVEEVSWRWCKLIEISNEEKTFLLIFERQRSRSNCKESEIRKMDRGLQ